MIQRIIDFLKRIFPSRAYRLSLHESKALADEFFGGEVPTKVAIPVSLRGEPTAKYAVRKFDDLPFRNKKVKILVVVNRQGQFGDIYTEGIDLNTSNTSSVVEIKKADFWRRFDACGDKFLCAMQLLAEMENDCKAKKDAENCWYCTKFGGGQDCSDIL